MAEAKIERAVDLDECNLDHSNKDDKSRSTQLTLTGRELGIIEIMHDVLLSRAGMGIYYHVVLLDSPTEVQNQHWLESFRVLVNFQPFMRMKIRRDSSGQRRFFEAIPVDHLPIKFLDSTSEDVEWTELMEKEQNANIQSETGPLWRAIIAPKVQRIGLPPTDQSAPEKKWEYTVVFYIHHGISDAVSCFDLFCNQLLPILNKVINSESPDDKFKTPLPLPPTFEEAVLGQKGPTTFGSPWYINAAVGLLRWKHRTFGVNTTHGTSQRPSIHSQEVPSDVENYCFSKHVISESTSTMIVAESRRHGVGVHSTLLTAFSYAAAQSMKEIGATLPPGREIKHNWPIDFRKQIPDLSTPHSLGVFASGGGSYIKLPESFEIDLNQSWLHAQKLNKCVKGVLKGTNNFGSKFLTHIVQDMCQREGNPFQVMIDCGFNISFTLSNLGNCDAVVNCDTTAPHFVDLKETYFGIAMNDFAKVLSVCGGASHMGPFITVLTLKGCMYIAVGYSDKWMSKEFMKKFLENTEENLIQMCKCSTEE